MSSKTVTLCGTILDGPAIDGDGVFDLVSPVLWFYIEVEAGRLILCVSDDVNLYSLFTSKQRGRVSVSGRWEKEDFLGRVFIVESYSALEDPVANVNGGEPTGSEEVDFSDALDLGGA